MELGPDGPGWKQIHSMKKRSKKRLAKKTDSDIDNLVKEIDNVKDITVKAKSTISEASTRAHLNVACNPKSTSSEYTTSEWAMNR